MEEIVLVIAVVMQHVMAYMTLFGIVNGSIFSSQPNYNDGQVVGDTFAILTLVCDIMIAIWWLRSRD